MSDCEEIEFSSVKETKTFKELYCPCVRFITMLTDQTVMSHLVNKLTHNELSFFQVL